MQKHFGLSARCFNTLTQFSQSFCTLFMKSSPMKHQTKGVFKNFECEQSVASIGFLKKLKSSIWRWAQAKAYHLKRVALSVSNFTLWAQDASKSAIWVLTFISYANLLRTSRFLFLYCSHIAKMTGTSPFISLTLPLSLMPPLFLKHINSFV